MLSGAATAEPLLDYMKRNPKITRRRNHAKEATIMKTIGTVLNLIEKAQARANKSPEGTGYAVQNRRERYYNWGGGATVGNMREVYRVDVLKDGMSGDTIQLYHYGTLTAEIWVASEPVLIYTYGESRSDADSVNTFLDYFRIDTRYTYKPVNGGFQEVAQ